MGHLEWLKDLEARWRERAHDAAHHPLYGPVWSRE